MDIMLINEMYRNFYGLHQHTISDSKPLHAPMMRTQEVPEYLSYNINASIQALLGL